jgi:hypothetical protein
LLPPLPTAAFACENFERGGDGHSPGITGFLAIRDSKRHFRHRRFSDPQGKLTLPTTRVQPVATLAEASYRRKCDFDMSTAAVIVNAVVVATAVM